MDRINCTKKMNLIYRHIIILGILGVTLFEGVVNILLPTLPMKYLCDVLLLTVPLFLFKCPLYYRQNASLLWFWVICFLCVGLCGIIHNGGNLLWFVWGGRNYYRFFVFFFFMIYFLSKRDIEWCVQFYEKTFIVHIILIAIQFVIGYRRDFLNGLWGIEVGGNGALNIYLMGFLCIQLWKFYTKKIAFYKLFICIMCICINGAVSELKFLFVEICIISFTYFCVTRFSVRNIKIIISVMVMFGFAVGLLTRMFPHWSGFFEIDNLVEFIINSKTYSDNQDIGRTAVFTRLTPLLECWDGGSSILFGLGLGQGDYATSFPILNSDFYIQYGYLHYTWLSLGYLFVETGYLGVFVYVMYFVSILIMSFYRYKIKKDSDFLVSFLFSLSCLMIILYNASLRNDGAYIAFFILAIPYCLKNDKFLVSSIDS